MDATEKVFGISCASIFISLWIVEAIDVVTRWKQCTRKLFEELYKWDRNKDKRRIIQEMPGGLITALNCFNQEQKRFCFKIS